MQRDNKRPKGKEPARDPRPQGIDPYDRPIINKEKFRTGEDPSTERKIQNEKILPELLTELTQRAPIRTHPRVRIQTPDIELPDAPIKEESPTPSHTKHQELPRDLYIMTAVILFDGKNPRGLSELFQVAEAEFKLSPVFQSNNEERKAAYIIARIRHPASMWYEQAKKANPEIENSYTKLKEAMIARYQKAPEQTKLDAQRQIGRIQQKGSVQAYYTYFMSIATDAGLKKDDDQAEQAFLDGLYPSLKRAILTHPQFDTEGSIDWMMHIAERSQAAYNSTKQRQERGRTPFTLGAQKKGTCYKCGRTGHYAKECYARTRVTNTPSAIPSTERGRSETRGRSSTRFSTPWSDQNW
jgi:hypothetical protein